MIEIGLEIFLEGPWICNNWREGELVNGTSTVEDVYFREVWSTWSRYS